MAVSSAISLYDQAAGRKHGGWMAGTAYSNPRGAEISERSSELVLPDASPLPNGKSATAKQALSQARSATHVAADDPGKPRRALASVQEPREFGVSDSEMTTHPAKDPEARADESAAGLRGIALPGDRGPRKQAPEAQRPSFWRRIALGRRTPEAQPESAMPPRSPAAEPAGLAVRVANAVAPNTQSTRAAAPNKVQDTTAIETRIVEPLLQALVSVEAKLERSHTDLIGRSDQVEQRLTQLWDIEEQLGTLSELQESLLQVSEQQRRLESAVISQTKTLRWLVGAVFFSLSAAAFTVAAILR
jgi:hypothetical protein